MESGEGNRRGWRAKPTGERSGRQRDSGCGGMGAETGSEERLCPSARHLVAPSNISGGLGVVRFGVDLLCWVFTLRVW